MFQRYTTPYIIVERNSDFLTYKLKDATSGKVDQNFTHFSKLKRFREPGDKPTDPIINHDEIQRNKLVQNQLQKHASISNNPTPIVNEHENQTSITANAPTEVIHTAGAGYAPASPRCEWHTSSQIGNSTFEWRVRSRPTKSETWKQARELCWHDQNNSLFKEIWCQ